MSFLIKTKIVNELHRKSLMHFLSQTSFYKLVFSSDFV